MSLSIEWFAASDQRQMRDANGVLIEIEETWHSTVHQPYPRSPKKLPDGFTKTGVSRKFFNSLCTRATNATKDHRRSIKKFNTRTNLISTRHPIAKLNVIKINYNPLLGGLEPPFATPSLSVLDRVQSIFLFNKLESTKVESFDGEVVNLSKSDSAITCRIKATLTAA